MKTAIDSSVIIAALSGADSNHEACRRILLSATHSIHAHALSETFSTLTGGRLGLRISPGDAASILRDQVAPRLEVELLTETDLLNAFAEAETLGIRGGAIYDYLHLFAARKAGAKSFYTLNTSDFLSFHGPGDPEILHP
jgi:predicted nucleic acid-binding protein